MCTVLGLGEVAITSGASLKNVMLLQFLHNNLLSTIPLGRAGYNSHFGEFHLSVFRRGNL